MKNEKNAFTLIELLAIIVILAIIAVITVPIILNIIENSRKGASIDSAYGYRDSIQQYFLSKSVGETTDPVLTTEVIKTVSELKTTDKLTVSGQEPSDGWVQLNKGQVVDYSLKFGDYVVNYDENAKSPIAIKGNSIESIPVVGGTISTCPGCVFAFYYDPKYLATEENVSNNELDTSLSSSEYTNDYTELEKNVFLGHILDNGKITRSFVCGIENEKPFCIEGGIYSEEIYNSNLGILENMYPSCSSYSSDCTGNLVNSGGTSLDNEVYLYDGDYRCEIQTDTSSYCSY